MVEMQLKSVVFVTLGSDPHSLFLKLNFIFDALSEIICLPFGSQCKELFCSFYCPNYLVSSTHVGTSR